MNLSAPTLVPVPKRDPGAGMVVRGTKLKLYPKPEQAASLDLWRRRTRSLWNLLLGIEQAAYSGEKFRPELGWRRIWGEVVAETYARDRDRWENGWRRSDGTYRKLAGEGKEPAAPTPTLRAAIEGGHRGGPPRVFLWERELNAVMARLKQVPLSQWIGDLPSHAAQHVVKDLIKALQAMLRERKKRAAGAGGRDTGFPRFKADRYASGSVYFANTQVQFDFDRNRVRLPNGVGWVAFDGGNRIGKGDKFMGARAWRRGDDWWLSPQFEMHAPAAPEFTGREVGVKVAGATLATVYDGAGFEHTMTPADDERAQRRLKLWGRRLARRLDAQAIKTRKVARRKGLAGGIRLKRSGGFYEVSERLARLQGREGDARNDLLHKTSRTIVDSADHIAIETVEVAEMMKRSDHAAEKRRRRREKEREAATGEKAVHHKAPAKVLRKAMRRAAAARLITYIKYKAEDGGRTVTETHALYPRVQICGAKLPTGEACGHLNHMMKDGRVRHQCGKCGAIMHRQENAAENIYQQGVLSRDSGLEAAE